MYWLSADYWILIISFCGPCRPNVESMNHSIVLVLLGKGWYYLKKLVLKEKHLNMNVYIFLFSTVFIVLLHLEGICPYIYSSITVIQIFVTKNNICPFSPFRKHPLHIFTVKLCIYKGNIHTPCVQATNKKTFINVFVFSIESTYKSLQ